MANGAHENLNKLIAKQELDEIVSSSIERIHQAGSGNWTETIHKAKTRRNEDRYIHTGEPMLMSEHGLQWLDDMIRNKFRQNPASPDTLASADKDAMVQRMKEMEQPNNMWKFFDYLKSFLK